MESSLSIRLRIVAELVFSALLYNVYQLGVKVNGPWKEPGRAMITAVTRLVPRLIGTIKSDGRPIESCLVHGDLGGRISAHFLAARD